MTEGERARVKSLMVSALAQKDARVTLELDDNLDLRTAGLIDSLGFVNLIAELEVRLGYRIDLADLNAADLTRVGPLTRHIAWRRALP